MCKFHLEGETNQQNEETTTEAAGDGFILVLITLGEPFSTAMQIIYGALRRHHWVWMAS